jgi:hypothetical protein
MRILFAALLALMLSSGVSYAQADSLNRKRMVHYYPYDLEVGGVWAGQYDIGNGIHSVGFNYINASAALFQSHWRVALAIQAIAFRPGSSPAPGVYGPIHILFSRYCYSGYAMAGWEHQPATQWGRAVGLRAGFAYRRRSDSFFVFSRPGEVDVAGARYYELGARLEAYGDLVRYRRIFLRGRVAYNLFSIANPRKHPNQAEASLNLGISLGRKR